jgi:hypothetical protein
MLQAIGSLNVRIDPDAKGRLPEGATDIDVKRV